MFGLANSETTGLQLPRLNDYPERHESSTTRFDDIALMAIAALMPFGRHRRTLGADAPILQLIRRQERKLANTRVDAPTGSAANALHRLRPALAKALRNSRPSQRLLAECLALLRQVSQDALGVSPYDVQLLAVSCLLRGEVCEMRTGEGKSLAAALAAAVMALAGQPVHVITVNDYLADRDLSNHRRLFQKLGLSSAMVAEAAPLGARTNAYSADIVYVSAKTVVFDYLRDRSASQDRPPTRLSTKLARLTGGSLHDQRILRGLPAAILDEADSVLIDQASTPFILAGQEVQLGGLDPDLLRQAFKLSAKLRPSYHYSVQLGLRQVLLTAEGKRRIRFAFASHSSLLSVPAIHQHLVVQALVARETLRPGRDYLVEDGKVLVIDEATGRQMPDRQWSDGLHQMVELSEGLKVTTMRVTTASISFQRFFPRYLHLCGMTGTARTAARELWRVYNLRVRQIAPRAGDARHWEPVRVFATSEARWEAVAHHAAKLSARGIPVLIGTRSVTASEACSRALTAEKLSHNLLNANSTAYEAAIIAEAGQVGRITVATNMAGRGTDIKLSNEARALGGLTVILTEMHDDRRIDLQLYGRCGRQGEKGQVLNILSLEDELMKTAPSFLQRIAAVAINLRNEHLAFLIMLLQQKLRSGMQSRVRNRLRANDRRRQQALGIAGMEE